MAMRLWLDSDRLAGRGLTAADVADAVRRNNYQAAPGKVKGQYVVANVRVNTDLTSVEEFRNMVVRNDGNGLVRLKDVGTVELGAAATETSALMDGEPAVFLGVFPTPTGNPLVIVDGIRHLMPAIDKMQPPGVKMALAFETARFIQASIDEVVHTLLEALVIVVAVIYLCLGSLRTVLIPVVTIPLSILGAAGLMLAFGFSVNLLTLLAMVRRSAWWWTTPSWWWRTCIVISKRENAAGGGDDRRARGGGAGDRHDPDAGGGLCADRPDGRADRRAVSRVCVDAGRGGSGVRRGGADAVAGDELAPAAGQTERRARGARRRVVLRRSDAALCARAGFSLRHRWLTGALALLVMISLPLLYLMPQRELAPTEDQAIVLTAIKAPQHANLNYVERFAYKLDEVYNRMPETESRWIINGSDGTASGIGGINLTLWQARQRSASAVQADLQRAVNDVEGTSIFAFQLPALPGSTGGLPVQMVLRTPQDYPQLYRTWKR